MTPAGDIRERGRARRTRAVAIAGASLGVLLIAGVALVATGGMSGDDGASASADAHEGMVDGTVWVANEAVVR